MQCEDKFASGNLSGRGDADALINGHVHIHGQFHKAALLGEIAQRIKSENGILAFAANSNEY